MEVLDRLIDDFELASRSLDVPYDINEIKDRIHYTIILPFVTF